jgi:nicotinamidase-related amidase
VNDALLVVDVLNDFAHDEGDRLRASFTERVHGMRDALDLARGRGVPVVYVNDRLGDWCLDRVGLVERALAGSGGSLIEQIVPRASEPLLLKARYSAFDHTPLDLLLDELQTERLVIVGAATEGCVVQTGIDARELGLKVTIVAGACATADGDREGIALRYAETVAGIVVVQNPRDYDSPGWTTPAS